MSPDRGRLRLAVVGCGHISAAWLEALPRVPAFALTDAVEPDPARRRTAAGTGAQVHSNLDDLLAAGPPDAALVLVPPAAHRQVACTLLDEGVHVLCEKPLATTVADAEAMLARAEAAGRLLLTAAKFRHVGDLQRAAELAAGGAIGRILRFENVFCAPADMSRRWNSRAEVAGGGVLMDNGCHAGDIAGMLLGPIRRVIASTGPPLQDLEVEDSAALFLESSSGVPGTVRLSWSCRAPDPWFVRLLGEEGVLEVGWTLSRLRRFDGEEQAFGSGYDKRQAFAGQLEDFAAAIAGGPNRISPADGLAALRFVAAAYASLDSGRWEQVEG